MAWISYTFQIGSRPGSALLDMQFAKPYPAEQLPRIAWFGVYCSQPAEAAFWHPDEGPTLDAIEGDLIRLCGCFGNGWAVYVRRLDTPGLREYYSYFGEGAELEKVLPCLKSLHAGYRIEFESRPDPKWLFYESWVQESKTH